MSQGQHRRQLPAPDHLRNRTIADVSIGSDQTRLIVLRGNSGSGRSTVAKALREAYGRGVAWVSQDLIRRTILREKDQPGGVNIGLIDQVTRYSLEHGYHVVLDGILYADTRPQAADFGADDMRDWYRARDLLGGVRECVIPETSTLQETTLHLSPCCTR